MKDLELRINNCYRSKSLSIEQLHAIYTSAEKSNHKKVFSPYLKYAAVFLLLLGSTYFLYDFVQKDDKILNEFAEEIAHNHSKNKPSKIKSNSVEYLNQELNELGFKIDLPKKITDHYRLIGGQYCSVDNRIAAQLKLLNKDEETITCYIFKKEEAFDFDKQIISEQVKVSLWNADSIIYAIAEDF